MKIASTKKRILQYADYKGVSKSDFYKKNELKRGLLDSDKLNQSISDIFLAKIIVNNPDINPSWLLTGKGDMLIKEKDSSHSTVNEPITPYNKPVTKPNMKELSNKFSSPTKRILHFIDYQGITKYEFHKKVGLSNGFLDKAKEMRTDNVRKIIDHYPINPIWLLTGKGDMLIKENDSGHSIVNEPVAPYNNPVAKPTVSLPKFGKGGILLLDDFKASAGLGLESYSDIQQEKVFTIPNLDTSKGFWSCIQAWGDSMYPTVQDGDWLICKKAEEVAEIKEGQMYVYVSKSSGIYIKRLYILKNRIPSDTDGIELRSDNSDYEVKTECFEDFYECWELVLKISSTAKNKVLEDMDKVLEEKDKVLEEKDKVLEEKDKVLEEKDKMIKLLESLMPNKKN